MSDSTHVGGPSHTGHSNSETKRRTVVARAEGRIESQCFKERGGVHFGMRMRDAGSREEWWWVLHKMYECV